MSGLTKRIIDSAIAPEKGDVRLWDDRPKGLGLRIKPSGTKTFFVQYTSPVTGRKERLTIGRFGALTLEEARTEAKKALGLVARDLDPKREKKLRMDEARRTAVTLAEFCDAYLRDAEEGLVTYRGRPKKASTLAIDRGRIHHHIKPLLGALLVRDITRKDAQQMFHAIRQGRTARQVRTGPRGIARVTGGVGTAARCLDLLGSIMSHAIRQDLRDDNPVRGIERPPQRRRDRILSSGEYAALGSALEAMEAEGANPIAVAAARALVLTGCRRQEIYRLKWSEVDAEKSALRLQDTKTGQQVRPIGRAAMQHLLAQPRLEGSPYVFPGARGGAPLADVRVFRRACKRAALEGVTLHTLRHSYASVALELEFSEMTVAALLGHRLHSVTARYAHHVDSALVQAATRVAETIARRLAPAPSEQNVIQLAG